jgi:hypothetical protein
MHFGGEAKGGFFIVKRQANHLQCGEVSSKG